MLVCLNLLMTIVGFEPTLLQKKETWSYFIALTEISRNTGLSEIKGSRNKNIALSVFNLTIPMMDKVGFVV